jgi:protein transport protein HofC
MTADEPIPAPEEPRVISLAEEGTGAAAEFDAGSRVGDPPPAVGVGVESAQTDLNQFMAPPKPVPWRLSDLMYVVAGVAVAQWVGMILGPQAFIGLTVLVGFASGVAFVVIYFRLRRARQDAMLSILAIAAERGMPLAPAVAAFADQYRGQTYARTMKFAARLNQGVSPPQAFRSAGAVVSRDSVVMAYLGDMTGNLSRALNLVVATRAARAPIQAAVATRATYILMLFLSMYVITGFIGYFIIPKFEAIFRDFGIPLPDLTKLAIGGTSAIADPYAVGFSMLFIRFLIPFTLLSIVLNAVGYEIPVLDRLFSRRHSLLILRSLALTVEAGKPIELGLATLADHYPVGWVKRKLKGAHREVRQGADWIAALWHYGFIRETEAAVLTSAQAVGNLRWAIMELADTVERRRNLRFEAAIQVCFPLFVVLIGLAVAFLAFAYFLPLVTLIWKLSESA